MFKLIPPIAYDPSRTGATASSNPLRIVMGPNGTGAVLAQEMWEMRTRWMLFNGPALLTVIGAAIAYNLGTVGIWAFFASFALLCFAILAPAKFGPVVRWLEVRGHEVETWAAVALYHADVAEYREAEAVSMIGWYDGAFSGMSVRQICDDMARHAKMAQAYVKRVRPTLEAFDRMKG